MMEINLDIAKRESLTGRVWVAESIGWNSNAKAVNGLDFIYGNQIGVAPDNLLAHEKTLEARLTISPDTSRTVKRETIYETLLRIFK